MGWKDEIGKSVRSLMMHRLRTLLSTLGVVFGVVAVVAMLSIGEGAKQETLEQIEQLGMNSLIIRQNTLSDEQVLQALEKKSKGLTYQEAVILENNIPQVFKLAPLKQIEASTIGTLKEIAPEILAVTRGYAEIKGIKVGEGRFICDSDHENKRLICVLGYEAARSLGKAGHVGQALRIENVQFEIVGILQSTHWKPGKNGTLNTRNLDKSIFIPLGAEKSLPSKRKANTEALSEITLQMTSSLYLTTAAQMAKHLLQRLHGGHEDYQIIIPLELFNQANRTQRTFNLVLGGIAALSLLVGGIGIMNIMLATVSERTREIGIRRAVGANKKHIMMQFLVETLVLTWAGALIGVLLGVAASFFIGFYAGWQTIVTLWSLLLSLGMAAGVGLCSGLYPAYKAAQMNPITALRHE